MKDRLKNVGIWGQRHYDHLKTTKPSVINVMRMNENLIPYLQSVDEQADEMFFQLVRQIAKQEGGPNNSNSKIKWHGSAR